MEEEQSIYTWGWIDFDWQLFAYSIKVLKYCLTIFALNSGLHKMTNLQTTEPNWVILHSHFFCVIRI